MFDEEKNSIDQQGRKLSAAFAKAEATEQKRRRQPRLKLAIAVGGATVLIALVGGTLLGGRVNGTLTVDEAVAAVSKAAFDQPGSEPNKYVYIKTFSADLVPTKDPDDVATPMTSETWSRHGDRTYWERFTLTQGGVTASSTCDRKLPKGYSQFDDASQLYMPKGEPFPANSQELYLALRGKNDDDPDGLYDRDAKVWDQIGMAMRDGASSLTPQQRVVLVGALAKIPDARTLGRIKDPNGNETIAFERARLGMRERLYFDAETSLTTYTSSVLDKPDEKYYPGRPVGTVLQKYALLDYKYLDALPDLKNYSPGKTKMGDTTTDFGEC